MRRVQSFVLGLFFFYITLGTAFSLYIPKSFAASDEVTVIPGEAIRLRILANSNDTRDQEVKHKVRDAVNEEITEWVRDLTSIDAARRIISERIEIIEQIVGDILQAEGMTYSAKVEFTRVPFPTKLYGNFLYPAGEYEAVLITLGAGTGTNWWCVLFPPLCFLDFSTGSAVSPGFEDDEEESDEQLTDLDEESNQADRVDEDAKDEERENEADSENQKPVYVEEEEVTVKFFVIELWEKFLDLF